MLKFSLQMCLVKSKHFEIFGTDGVSQVRYLFVLGVVLIILNR